MSTAMLLQIAGLKREAGEAVLLTRMGDFYEILGEDAVRAAPVLEIALTVGAQWELRRPLARTDQRLGGRDTLVRAHVDRRSPPVIALLGCFSNEQRQKPLRIEILDAKR
jgi:hypothetical protein